jgi:hypothetical protein
MDCQDFYAATVTGLLQNSEKRIKTTKVAWLTRIHFKNNVLRMDGISPRWFRSGMGTAKEGRYCYWALCLRLRSSMNICSTGLS